CVSGSRRSRSPLRPPCCVSRSTPEPWARPPAQGRVSVAGLLYPRRGRLQRVPAPGRDAATPLVIAPARAASRRPAAGARMRVEEEKVSKRKRRGKGERKRCQEPIRHIV